MVCSSKVGLLCLLGAVLATGTSGFEVPVPALRRQRLDPSILPLIRMSSSQLNENNGHSVAPHVVYTPESSQSVTPNQIMALRKEFSKRQARKQLVKHRFVDYQQTSNSSDEEAPHFLQAVCQDLEDHELVQIRGVCPNQKSLVFETAEKLAFDLSAVMKRDVTFVGFKGHAVNLYCPSSDLSKRKVVLRSSFQEGAWAKKPKARRDYRGQVIRD